MPKTANTGKESKDTKRTKVSRPETAGGPGGVGGIGGGGGGTTGTSRTTETYTPVLPPPVGTDPTQLIFPEWTDHDVNVEKWDVPRASRIQKKSDSFLPPDEETCDDHYIDPHDYALPASISVTAWKRPHEIYPSNTTFVIFRPSPNYSEMLKASKHLLNSEFVRQFISSITILEYLGWHKMWPIEGVNVNYVPTTGGEPWKGWHHIYANQKVGKGARHLPTYNKYGKYVVRLYWMGTWRKIIVDDMIPMNNSNYILLPNLDSNMPTEESETEMRTTSLEAKASSAHDRARTAAKRKSSMVETKHQTIELWPWLLCKALFKIANITWTEENEIVDFDIIACLTGWVLQKVNTSTLNGRDIWDMCHSYSDHFSWFDPRGRPESRSSPDSSRRHSLSSQASSRSKKSSTSKKTAGSKEKKSNKQSNKPKKDPKEIKRISTTYEDTLPYCLVALLSDLRDVELEDVAPCWSHLVLIDQTRNTPLTKPEFDTEIQPWKRFRWVQWAVAEGLLPDERFLKAKCLKLVVPMRLCNELLTFQPSIRTSYTPRQSVRVIEELMLTAMKRYQESSAAFSKKRASQEKKKDKDKDPDADSKKAGSKKDDKKKPDKLSRSSRQDDYTVYPPPENPAFWGDFGCMFRHFAALHIYLRPTQFLTSIHITDLEELGPSKSKDHPHEKHVTLTTPTQRIEKRVVWPRELAQTRNDALYMFIDTMDYKFILLNMAQEGNREFLQSKSDDFTYEIADRIQTNVIVERYNWQNDEVGETVVCLSTYGNRSILVHEPPGRSVMRLWIHAPVSYSIIVLGDGPIFIDTKEKILELMQYESQALIQTCYNIGSNFGKLVGGFGMTNYCYRLQDFYASYKPTAAPITKKESNILHEVFMSELARHVKDRVNSNRDIMYAMRVLFLNPSLDLKNTLGKAFNPLYMKQQIIDEARDHINVDISNSMQDVTSSLEESIEWYKQRQMSAVTLQSFFRMIYMQKIKGYHVIENPKFPKIFEALKKLYRDVFYIDARPDFIGEILRKVVFDNPRTAGLVKKYDFYSDLQNVINLQCFTGHTKASKESWIPIGRYVFFIDSPIPELVHICLFTNVTHYVLRVFNNDTNQEMDRMVNTVSTLTYTINSCGYTVLGYGWTSRYQDNVHWKFSFLTLRKRIRSLVIIPNKALLMQELSDFYKPNVTNLICRCIVSVPTDVAASFRLYCSSLTVQLKLQYCDAFGRVCGSKSGVGSIILPVASFKQHVMLRRETSYNVLKQRQFIRPHSRSKRKSDRSSVTSATYSSSKRTRNASSASLIPSTSRSNEDFCTMYLVEGFVLNNSWPLTMLEWNMVDEVKKRNLFSHERIPPRTPGKMSRRSSYSDRRPSEPFAQFTSPVWCLQMVYDQSDPITINIDRRRDDEIKAIKKKWYDEEPGRYEKSKELRMKYLRETYIQPKKSERNIERKTRTLSSVRSRQSSLTRGNSFPLFDIREDDDRSESFDEALSATKLTTEPGRESEIQRTLVRPMSQDKILPPLRYEAYAFSRSDSSSSLSSTSSTLPDFSQGRVKRPADEKRDASQMISAIENAADSHWKNRRSMGDWLRGRIDENLMMENWFTEIRDETANMMIDAYKLRAKFIDMTIEKMQMQAAAMKAAAKAGDPMIASPAKHGHHK